MADGRINENNDTPLLFTFIYTVVFIHSIHLALLACLHFGDCCCYHSLLFFFLSPFFVVVRIVFIILFSIFFFGFNAVIVVIILWIDFAYWIFKHLGPWFQAIRTKYIYTYIMQHFIQTVHNLTFNQTTIPNE